MSAYFLIDPRFDPYRIGVSEERAEVLPRITYLVVDAIDRSVRSIGAKVRSLASAVAIRFRQGQEHRAAVAELSRLDDRMLRDIGVSRADIEDALLKGRTTSGEIVTAVAAKPAAKNDGTPAGDGFIWRKAA